MTKTRKQQALHRSDGEYAPGFDVNGIRSRQEKTLSPAATVLGAITSGQQGFVGMTGSPRQSADKA